MTDNLEEQFLKQFNSLNPGEFQTVSCSCLLSQVNNKADNPVSQQTIDACARPVPYYQSSKPSRPLPPLPRGNELTLRSVREFLAARQKNNLPKCLLSKANALLYMSLVSLVFEEWVSSDPREDIIKVVVSKVIQRRSSLPTLSMNNIIPWLCKQLDTTWLIAALALGDEIGMKPENCFNRFVPNEGGSPAKEVTCQGVLPKVLEADDTVFTQKQSYPIRSVAGKVLQRVYSYASKAGYVTVYADARDQLGQNQLTAIMPAADLINAKPTATIHLCLCPDVLWAYLALARDGKLAEREGVVVTGCFGGLDDFDAIVLKPLAYHEVVLVCSRDRDEWGKIDKLAKRCLDNGASSVSIFSVPFKTEQKQSSTENSDREEIDLLRIECVSALARRINEKSVPYERKEISLQQKTIQDGRSAIEDMVRPRSFDEMASSACINISSDKLTIKDFFTSNYRTMVYGDSNVGKSFFMQQLALSCATGAPAFFLSASAPAKVMYIDGEMDKSFKIRMNQLLNGKESTMLNENLKVIQARGLSLSNTEVREAVLNELRKFNPDLVITDNIFSFLPEAVKGNTESMLDFVRAIEKIRAAAAFVHHTGKDGKSFKGAVELAALCQNVIHLKGKEQIKEAFLKEECQIPLPLAAAIDDKQNGTVISVEVEKCKASPELEGKPQFYRLPMGGIWTPITIGDEKEAAPTASEVNQVAEETEDTSCTQHTESPELTEEEQEIIKYVKEKGRITNGDVRKLFGCEHSKASNLLTGLHKKGILVRRPKGRETYYNLA